MTDKRGVNIVNNFLGRATARLKCWYIHTFNRCASELCRRADRFSATIECRCHKRSLLNSMKARASKMCVHRLIVTPPQPLSSTAWRVAAILPHFVGKSAESALGPCTSASQPCSSCFHTFFGEH